MDKMFAGIIGWVAAFATVGAIHSCYDKPTEMPVRVLSADRVPAAHVGIECRRDNGCPITVPSNDAGVVVIMPCDVDPASDLCWRAAPSNAVGFFTR